MRIVARERGYFRGTHKGHEIEINREKDGRFDIVVTCLKTGLHGYYGYAPEGIRTMAAAKREARRGAWLDHPPAETGGE